MRDSKRSKVQEGRMWRKKVHREKRDRGKEMEADLSYDTES